MHVGVSLHRDANILVLHVDFRLPQKVTRGFFVCDAIFHPCDQKKEASLHQNMYMNNDKRKKKKKKLAVVRTKMKLQ